eukprot:gene28684-34903_t
MWMGIRAVRPGARLGDIGWAIERHAKRNGYSVVHEYCGHGIGREMHEEPQILHFGKPGTGLTLREGMVFTIEPMLNQGRRTVKTQADGWTVVTRDGSLSAQFEHTVAVTASGVTAQAACAGWLIQSAVQLDGDLGNALALEFCAFQFLRRRLPRAVAIGRRGHAIGRTAAHDVIAHL